MASDKETLEQEINRLLSQIDTLTVKLGVTAPRLGFTYNTSTGLVGGSFIELCNEISDEIKQFLESTAINQLYNTALHNMRRHIRSLNALISELATLTKNIPQSIPAPGVIDSLGNKLADQKNA